MTSVEIPYSIAAALPSLIVVDITNDVRREIEDSGLDHGIVFVSAVGDGVVRVNEREAGFFDDVERMLERLVPLENGERIRMLSLLLGPRTEQVPFAERDLCLGTWQRILFLELDRERDRRWLVQVVGV